MSRNARHRFSDDIYSICSTRFNFAKAQFWEKPLGKQDDTSTKQSEYIND